MRYVHQRISPSICRTMLTNQCPIEVFADKLRRRSAEAQSAARRTETPLSERQMIDNKTDLPIERSLKEVEEGELFEANDLDDLFA